MHRHRLSQRLAVIAYASLFIASPRSASAGGVEATVAGARALGRGGAMTSSAEGFDALRYNPARLVIASGYRIQLDAQLHDTNVCFDRADAMGTDYARVCNTAAPGIVPQLGMSVPLGERFALGLGLLAPPGVSGLEFGDAEDGTIGQGTPSPARYANVVTNNLAAWPSIGLGARLHDRIRVGLTFGAGFVTVENISFTAGVPGAPAALDSRTALGAADRFVPRLTIGIDAEPVPGLGVSWVTTYTDDVYADAALFVSGTNGGGFSTRVDGVTVKQPMGWETTVGVRYARPRWDVELDTMLQARGRTQQVIVDIPDDATIPIDSTIDGVPLRNLPDERRVDRRWKHQLVLRAGGEGEVIEDRLRLRTGISFESRGVRHGYESVDNFLVRRVGLHFGASVDLHPRVELTASFARIFQPTTTVAPEDAGIEQPVAARPAGLADTHVYVNAGTYRGSLNAFGIAIVVRQVEPREAQ